MLKSKNVILLCGLMIIVYGVYYHISHATEEFTPSMRTVYRPYLRNIAVVYDSYFNYYLSRTTKLLKKIKLI
jgi:hypothetical protein